ncbi:unnamed protein product [Dicrocoelium dendriticum]|nr:unnamed protein product [Dicrocoelium dendriticum]
MISLPESSKPTQDTYKTDLSPWRQRDFASHRLSSNACCTEARRPQGIYSLHPILGLNSQYKHCVPVTDAPDQFFLSGMLALVPILCPASEAHTPRGTTVGARRHFHTNRLPSIRQPLSRSKKLQWRSAIPRQTNNNAMPGRHLVLTEDHTKLSPSSIAVNSINSSPSHRFDQPCTCIHCRYMGPNRVRTLSPATVRSPDPTITDLYQAKSFTLSPELSPREIFSDSLEVPPSIPGRVPILGGTWAWDTRYVPYQYPEAPWLPSGKLSSLYVKQFTCCRCGKKKRITDRRVGSPGEMPCCRSVLQKRRHKRYAFLHSDAAKMEGNWLFQPREKIPERFPDDDCAGHCQLMPRNAFTIGDSSTEWRRAKSVELTGGNTPARPASEQKISSSNYFLKGGRLFGTPVPFSLFERDMPPKDPETKISRSTSPIQGSRDAKSVIRPKPCPRNLVLPVLSPPHGPTDEQMHRYLRRHCHQRVIAFNDADGIFYPGLIQKCVAPESSIVRFRHNGTLLEVPNQLTLPVVDMLHTQSLNVGDTALVRVKNLNAACECWVPARIVGGFLGSPDPRYPLRHRYKLRLFSGAKHVFRRRDILRISPLFYKSLIEYIKTKRGIEEPESPTASGEGKPRPIRKRRKRVHPEPEPPLVPRPKQRRRIYKKEVKPPSPQPKGTPKAADSLIPKPMPRRAPEKREKPTTQSPERVVPMATPQKSVVASKPPEIPARAPRVAARPPAPVVPPQPPPRPVLSRPEFPREPTKKVLKEEPKPPTATAVPNKMKAKKTPVKRAKKPFTQAKMPYGKALHGDQKTTQVSSRVSSVDPTAIEALLVLAEEVHHQTTNDLGDEVLPQRLDQTDYDQSKEVEAMQTPEETENTVSIREESVHEAQEEDLWGTDSLNLESEQQPSVQSVLEEFENMDIINPYVDNMDTGELLAPPAGETLSYGAQVLSKEADRSLTDIPTEPLSEVHEPPVAVSVEIEEPLVKDDMPEPQAVFLHIDRDPEVVYEIEDELTESTKSAIEPITRTTVPQQEYIATDEEPVGEEIFRITEGKSDALEVPSKRIPDGYHEQVQDTTVSHLNQELVGSAASVSSSLDSADLSEERSVPLYEAPQIKPHVPVEKDRTEDQRGASKLRELGPDDRSKEGLSSRMAQVSTAKPPLPSRLHGQPTKTTPVSNYAKEEKVSAKTLRKQLQDADSERTATPVGGEVRSMEVLAESKGSVETVSKQQKNAHLKRAAASKSPQRAAVREQSKKRMHDGTHISDSSSVTHLSSVSSEAPDYVEDVTQGGTQVVVINLSDTNEFPQQRLARDNVFSEQLYDEAVKSKTSGTISPHGLLELHQSAESVADHVTRLDSIDDETGARTQFTPKETAGSVQKLPPNRREDLSSESMARSTTIPQYLSEPEAPKEHYTHDETGVQQITGKVTQEDIGQFGAAQQVKPAGIPLDGEPGELGIDTATAIAIARTGSTEKRRPGEEIPIQPPEYTIDKDRSMQHETPMTSESKWAKEPQVVRSDHEPKLEEPLIRKLDDIDSSKVHTEQERELKYQQAMYQKDDQHTAERRVFGTAPVSVESEDRQRREALATKSDDTTGYLRAPAESVTSGQSLIAQRIPQVPDVATVKERSEGEQLVLPTGEVVRGSVEAGREPVPPYDEAHRMAIEPGIAEGGTFGTAPLSVESDYRQRSEALATKSDDTTGYLRAPAESVTSGQSLIAQRIPQVPDVATVRERSEGEQLVLPTGEVVRGSVEADREPVPPYDEAHRMVIEPGIAEGGTFGTAPLSVESDYRQRSER